MKWKQGVKSGVEDRRESPNQRTIREYWDNQDGSRYQDRPPMRGEEALRRRNQSNRSRNT